MKISDIMKEEGIIPNLSAKDKTSILKELSILLLNTFKLKENVVWHDGKPFTADDVIFTAATIQDPGWQSQLPVTNHRA